MNKPLLLITTLLCFGLSLSSFAQSKIDFIEKLAPSDRQANDQFGWNMDSDSTFLVAGVPNCTYWDKNETVDFSGAVYVYKFEKDKLVFHQKVFAPIPKKESSFGVAIALHKDVLVVGAHRYRKKGQSRYQTIGGVYIYRLIDGQWEFEQFVLNPFQSNRNNGRFGAKLAVHGNYIIAVGRSFYNSLCLIKYQNEKWEITERIVAKDTTFGCDASIYDKTVVIGSKNYTTKNGKVSQKGKVYLYSIDANDKLKLQKSIVPLAENNIDIGFGSEVELYENTLLVGAETSYPQKKSGALYFYNIDRQTYETRLDTVLKANEPLNCDWYGHSFDLFQNILVVGAMGNTIHKDTTVEYMGAAYIYEKKDGNWRLVKKEHAINPKSWDKYGFSVSIFDSNIFIGCRFDNEDEDEKHWTENAGAIYRYELLGE